ncbi:MAG TPA: hypothetical protein VH370_22285, partial [Humisphaera sp.]|nr:hypothetical protein [Humisphaera sp.]
RRMRQHVRDKPKAGLSNITHTCKNAASEKPGADRCTFGTVLGSARPTPQSTAARAPSAVFAKMPP